MCSIYSIHKAWQLQAQRYCMYIIQNIQVLNHQCRTALWCYKCTESDGWMGWRSRWGKHRDHQYGANKAGPKQVTRFWSISLRQHCDAISVRNRMNGWDGRPCGRVNLEGTNTVLKKSRTPAGHGECLSRGSRRLLRIFKLIMRRIETNFKEDFLKEEVVEKYIFPLSPNLCKMTFSCCRSADYMSDRLIPLVKRS